jgi:hypothetical protein
MLLALCETLIIGFRFSISVWPQYLMVISLQRPSWRVAFAIAAFALLSSAVIAFWNVDSNYFPLPWNQRPTLDAQFWLRRFSWMESKHSLE